jgi:hypothetical protein
MAKDTFWFSHDSNAKDDPKCMLLIDQLGLEGYGIYWVLVEILRDQPEYKYPFKLLPVLAKRYFTSSEKFIAVVSNYGLFTLENDEFFFSNSLMDRMKPLEVNREKRRIAGIKSGEARRQKLLSENEQNVNTCSTHDEHMMNKNELSKVKESKVKESKVKDNKVKNVSKLSLTDRQTIFYDQLKEFLKTYSKDMVRSFYDYWSEPNQQQTKMRFEMETTWDTSRRLANWHRREKQSGFNASPSSKPVQTRIPVMSNSTLELEKLAKEYETKIQVVR